MLRWERIPVLAVSCAQQKKFAIEGIAERKAARFREAGDGVEKELLAFVGVLQFPRYAAVGCFVDAGFFAFAAGHDVGGGDVNATMPRKSRASPPATCRRFQSCLVERGRITPFEPDAHNDRHRHAFFIGSVSGAHAAQIGIKAAGLHLPPLSLHRHAKEQRKQKWQKGRIARILAGELGEKASNALKVAATEKAAKKVKIIANKSERGMKPPVSQGRGL